MGNQTIVCRCKYEGEVEQHAMYVMFDNRWKNKFRLVWGLRAEYFQYDLISQQMESKDSRNFQIWG
jgi:hypothetical protein